MVIALGALALSVSPRAYSQNYPSTGIAEYAFEIGSPLNKPESKTSSATKQDGPSLFGSNYPNTNARAIAPRDVIVDEASRNSPALPSFKIASPIRANIPTPTFDGKQLLPMQSDPSEPFSAAHGNDLLAFPSGPALDLPPQPTTTPAPPSTPLATAAPMFPLNATATDTLETVEPTAGPSFPLFPLPVEHTPPQTQTDNGPLAISPNVDAPNDLPTPPQPNLAKDDDSNASDGEDAEEDPDPASSPIPGEAIAETFEGEYFGGYGCGDTHDPHAFFDPGAFSPDPNYDHIPYSSVPELGVYEGKWNMCSQRPLIELGRGRYRNGVVPRSYSFLGSKNLITPGFTVFGDFRTAVAANDNGAGNPKFIWANRLNLDFDLRLTATERIHAFWGPLDDDGRFTRVESFTDGRNDLQFFEELDEDFDTLFFEGDMGYIWGGMTDQWAPFDLPFVVGKFPLLFQNGVWINDAVEGFAFTLPAKHSRVLNWSNFDLTMFFLFDDIDSGAFAGDDNAADAYGFNLFLEAYGGYTEAGYAYLEDRAGLGRSYHNMTVGFTRRYRQRLSNSVRVIVNSGQDPNDGVKTADGQIVIIENSLVSSNPTYFVPYFNMFAGFGTPQNLAGQAVLQNVGINFETDGLTGYPQLNASGQDTWGGAFGFNLLGPRFSWQLILEAAMVQNFGDNLVGDQYAVGARIQKTLNYAWLARFDAMYGLRENDNDIGGVRAELRWKF